MEKSVTIFLFFLILSLSGYSQDTIITVNNDHLVCKVISEDSSAFLINIHNNGKIKRTFINKSEVKSIILKKNEPKVKSSFYIRKFIVHLDLIIPSIGFETRLSDNTTFNLAYQPGLIRVIPENEKNMNYIINQFRGGFRFYKDLEKRFDEGLNTSKFSGSFFSIPIVIAMESPVSNTSITFGPALGIQRTWGEIVHFSLELGGGLTTAKNDELGLTFFGDLKFGFAF
jgi:hypothetical protein